MYHGRARTLLPAVGGQDQFLGIKWPLFGEPFVVLLTLASFLERHPGSKCGDIAALSGQTSFPHKGQALLECTIDRQHGSVPWAITYSGLHFCTLGESGLSQTWPVFMADQIRRSSICRAFLAFHHVWGT